MYNKAKTKIRIKSKYRPVPPGRSDRWGGMDLLHKHLSMICALLFALFCFNCLDFYMAINCNGFMHVCVNPVSSLFVHVHVRDTEHVNKQELVDCS